MTPQDPTIGRVVVYRKDGENYAAFVCYVWGPACVNLFVVDHNGNGHPKHSVCLGDESQDGVWFWPTRS